METEKERCNQCRRGCFIDNLQCGRGRMFFAMQKQDQEENHGVDEPQLYKQEIIVDDNRRVYDMTDNMNNQENELITVLEKCGHFLHHKQGGHRGQDKILKILVENPGISQKELQERLGIQSGSISEIAIKLESKGFIIRIKDEEDKRMTKLELTEVGLAHWKAINVIEEQADNKLFQTLSSEEQDTLKILLSKLVEDWNKSYDLSNMRRGHKHHGCGCKGKEDRDNGCHHEKGEHHGHGHHHDKECHHEHGQKRHHGKKHEHGHRNHH